MKLTAKACSMISNLSKGTASMGNTLPFQKVALDTDGFRKTFWSLKKIAVFYSTKPFPRSNIHEMYNFYMNRFGSNIKRYSSTAPGSFISEFDRSADQSFRTNLIQNLYETLHWGYAFDDGQVPDSFMFAFHSYKPVSEPGRSSFCRFEFPYDADPESVREFAFRASKLLPFTSGTCGYVLRPSATEPSALDHMYAMCQRFWGIEAWNLDVTVKYLGNRFKCVSWLTFIGESIAEEFPEALKAARHEAQFQRTSTGTMFQTRAEPALIDRNRSEEYDTESRLARALLPAQTTEHGSFGGMRWTEDNSLAWLYRFTS
ncbi:type VI immunity family protein [Mesorhizobium sp.]|uniref:type VI immunity family protein n=1 Tax=Mesorhizobium sp. TaxID=1871066 RepID=UPI00257A84E5|nr:type VI immunity family protein [Mesorhizobium sp.]